MRLCASLAAALSIGCASAYNIDRRRAALGVAAAATLPPQAAVADGTLGDLRKYTALAPLGSSDAQIGSVKRKGMSLEELSRILAHDVAFGANGEGGYFVSGDLTPEIFQDDCRFIDPTNEVSSLSRYKRALGILFDPIASRVMLLAPPTIDTTANTITARVRSAGVLQLPWRPSVAPYTTTVVWQIDGGGLVSSQSQTWSITAVEALRETFTPGAKKSPSSDDFNW